jgi:hypothetical protein
MGYYRRTAMTSTMARFTHKLKNGCCYITGKGEITKCAPFMECEISLPSIAVSL